jgi:cyclopropane fatty-acyl-phospholipid synthase-like methyltransferase
VLVKLKAPAAERNRAPILEVLREELPHTGTVLEIASGSGTHAVYFARELTPLRWQPSDLADDALESIGELRDESGLLNLDPPLRLDVREPEWPIDRVAAIVCINMLHIAPWEAAEALFRGASRVLPRGGPLCTYGPYRFDGSVTAASNQEFDRDLRARNPAWGLRDVRDLEVAARSFGLDLARTVPRPANNHVLVFRRQ